MPCNSSNLSIRPLVDQITTAITGESVMIIGYPGLGTRQIQLDVPAVRKGHIASTEISIDSVPMLFLDLVSLGGYSGSPVILEATGHMLCR
jgi:hypothetical protein